MNVAQAQADGGSAAASQQDRKQDAKVDPRNPFNCSVKLKHGTAIVDLEAEVCV